MKKANESSIEKAFSEEIESFAEALENLELLKEFSLFSAKELEWIDETFANLDPGKEKEIDYKSYKLSPSKRRKLKKARDRHKNYKSRVKWKVTKEAIDLARVAWVHREYSDEALEDMFPLSTILMVVRTLVFRFGQSYAIAFASAIENGMLLSQFVDFPEYPDLFEVSVPVTVRIRQEKAGELSYQIMKRGFEKFAEKQSERSEE